MTGIRPRHLIWGALFAALAVVLCLVSLFDLLGYEFSFVFGFAASFCG